jgi:hypothetical protein
MGRSLALKLVPVAAAAASRSVQCALRARLHSARRERGIYGKVGEFIVLIAARGASGGSCGSGGRASESPGARRARPGRGQELQVEASGSGSVRGWGPQAGRPVASCWLLQIVRVDDPAVELAAWVGVGCVCAACRGKGFHPALAP